jgi:hypothetical protein
MTDWCPSSYPMTAPSFDDAVATAIATRRHGDYASALQLFLALAEQGDPTAQYNLGVMYSKGEGVPQDYAKAAMWHTLAADQGNANSQFYLGMMYEKGQGVTQDNVVSHKWFTLSAAQSNQEIVRNQGTAPQRMSAAINATGPDKVPLSKERLEQLIAQIMSTVAVIDALLARDLSDPTRRDLKAFRDEAVAGRLSLDDEKYVRHLYARISASKAPYVPTARSSFASNPIELSWLDGFLGRITLVGAVIGIPIIALIIGGVAFSAFTETKGSLLDRIGMGIVGAGVAALSLWFLFGLAARIVMICLGAVGLGLRSVYWLVVGK